MAILYAALLGIIYREMHVKDMVQGLKETVCSTASIMLIVSAASVFSWILTKERIPADADRMDVSPISTVNSYS